MIFSEATKKKLVIVAALYKESLMRCLC